MSRLGPVLTEHDLPAAELMAARLDGELVALDGAWTPVDEIEQPRHRALSLALRLPEGLIIEQRSAAWVWGAIRSAPAVHQLCVAANTTRVRAGDGWPTVREVVIDGHEIWTIGLARVTSPLRTIVDLARFADGFGPELQDAVLELLKIGDVTIADCLTTMEGRRNLPSKRRAVRRLTGLLAQGRTATAPGGYEELTRYTS